MAWTNFHDGKTRLGAMGRRYGEHKTASSALQKVKFKPGKNNPLFRRDKKTDSERDSPNIASHRLQPRSIISIADKHPLQRPTDF
jgi:hypothetical protein